VLHGSEWVLALVPVFGIGKEIAIVRCENVILMVRVLFAWLGGVLSYADLELGLEMAVMSCHVML
jgi:hypothetical protein